MYFELRSPDDRYNDAFSAYACHQQQIEDFIEILAATDDPNDPHNQIASARCVGLDWRRLSPNEIEYIENEVSKKYE